MVGLSGKLGGKILSLGAGGAQSFGDAGAFYAITTLKSDTSGAQTITPAGLPVPWDTLVSRTNRTKIFARVVGGDGTFIPVQTEQFKHREQGDDGLQHCTMHFALPSSYTAGTKVEIGYHTTESQPSVPDWATLWASGANIEVKLNVWTNRVHYTKLLDMHSGDIFTFTFSDSLGADQVYAYEYDLHSLSELTGDQPAGGQTYYNLARLISLASGGRYTCVSKLAASIRPLDRLTPGTYATGWDNNFAQYGNSYVTHNNGYRYLDNNFPNDFQPVANASGSQEWPQGGLYFYPRDGLKPGNWTLSCAVTRVGEKLPTSGLNTIGNGYRKLSYDTKTADFLTNGYIKGVTSGTRAYMLADGVVGGTTGTLHVIGVTAPGFTNGEDLIVLSDTDVTLGGAAKVNGALAFQTITSSSGGSAKFLSAYDNAVYIKDKTGTFLSGDTLTSDFGTCTQNGALVASTAAFNNTYNTTATTGAITPINDSVAAVMNTATFNGATETANSPWFDGHQVRQLEKKMAPLAGAVAHPHLEVYFRVSRDRNGTIVDRQIMVENSKRKSEPVDYWYDAEVLVDGVSQTTGNTNYDGLFHEVWQSWGWDQAKNNYVCDPADFMKARIISPWIRYPTWDAREEMKAKLVGAQMDTNTNFTYPTASYRAPAVKSSIGVPLYPGPWDFGAAGGARMELGDYNSLEAIFWMSDVLKTLPSLLALAGNNMNAQGFNVRMTGATGDDEEDVPNFYTAHAYNWSYNTASDGKLGKRSSRGVMWPTTYTQRWTLSPLLNPRQSHSCSTGQFSAYVARPEKKFYDSIKQWAWYQNCNYEGTRVDLPKTGGVAGDADHRMGYRFSNGERSYARIARDLASAGFVSFEGSRNRTMWRRVVGDMAYWANEITAATMWGMFIARQETRGSDSTAMPVFGQGQPMLATFGNLTAANASPDIDVFKIMFCHVTVARMLNLGVANVLPAVKAANWFVRVAQKATNGNWWNGVAAGYSGRSPAMMTEDIAWNGSRFVINGTYPFNASVDETMNGIKAFKEALTDATQKTYFQIFATVAAWSSQGNSEKYAFLVPGYSLPKSQYGAMLFYSLYTDDATLKAAAESTMASMDAYAPGNDAIPYAGYSPYTYAQVQQQTGYVTYSQVLNW